MIISMFGFLSPAICFMSIFFVCCFVCVVFCVMFVLFIMVILYVCFVCGIFSMYIPFFVGVFSVVFCCGCFRDGNGTLRDVSLDRDGNCVINYRFCDYLVGDSFAYNCSAGGLFGLFAVNLSSGELLCKKVGGVLSGDGCVVNYDVFDPVPEIIVLKDPSLFNESLGLLRTCVHGSEYVCLFNRRYSFSCSVFSCPLGVLLDKGIGVFSLNPFCFGRFVDGRFVSVFEGARPLFDAWCGLVGLGGGFVGVPMDVNSSFLIR